MTNINMGDMMLSDMSAEDFANSFGTTIDDLPHECVEMINSMDFRYRRVNPDERDHVLLEVIRKIDSQNLTVSGKARRNDWERGWSENLHGFIDRGYNTDELIPRYYQPGFYARQILRFNKTYIEPVESAFEINWFSVFRHWLFMTYLSNVDNVYEFGCGTGHNLIALAKLYPEKKLYGLDWAASSQEVIENVNNFIGYNIMAGMFDMFNPDDDLNIAENSAVMTIVSLEQLGSNYDAFLQFILKKSPALCLHIEPTMELYDNGNLLDYLAIKYHRLRGYQETFLTSLRQLEAEGKIEIMKTKRTLFGSLYHEGYTYIVWRKVKTAD